MKAFPPHSSIETARLKLRCTGGSDLAALTRVLAEPGVSRRWPGFDMAKVRAELIDPAEDVVVLAIEHLGEVIGAIQFGENEDPQYRHASVDLFLGTAWWGKGLGPEAIRAVVRHLFEERGHHRVVIDPAADNARAIAAYEKVGFRRVGVMRQYERGGDGRWHDGLLMELVASDLRTQ